MSLEVCVTTDPEPCFALRRQVFIDEQQVPEEEEWDALDAVAIHLLMTDAGRPLGTARLIIDGDAGKIGRVCVLGERRGTGAGALLMRFAIAHLRARGDLKKLKLSAQSYAIGFYEKLGFTAYGPEYDDAGIPHRDMVMAL
ncbi:GNAT family N-acetyltransferase [Falsigemmobacter faecalis]|uniref:GNAT family N-acetyltransferase n=1 Tax=Falsigemmobacter faecalis TaxID=2488730 RepID=A0A3P3DWK4_9RHOB|nr:GNAT family N-acetyltransferase [Falsigemmobacter faecalis]RRH78575.1 GNAT family N-acetyltransferase [Falsigemmobacter faecalis]